MLDKTSYENPGWRDRRLGDHNVGDATLRSPDRRPQGGAWRTSDNAWAIERTDRTRRRWLVDLGSLNGTWFLNRRIGRTVVRTGDETLGRSDSARARHCVAANDTSGASSRASRGSG